MWIVHKKKLSGKILLNCTNWIVQFLLLRCYQDLLVSISFLKKFKKIIVRNAVQVFSQMVSSIMIFLACKYYYFYILISILYYIFICISSKQMLAALCLMFDQIFYSVNGSYDKVVDGKIFRTGGEKFSTSFIVEWHSQNIEHNGICWPRF